MYNSCCSQRYEHLLPLHMLPRQHSANITIAATNTALLTAALATATAAAAEAVEEAVAVVKSLVHAISERTMAVVVVVAAQEETGPVEHLQEAPVLVEEAAVRSAPTVLSYSYTSVRTHACLIHYNTCITTTFNDVIVAFARM
jgi:hypothetical protein